MATFYRCRTALDDNPYNLTFVEGQYFAPKDKCQMYNISWSTECPEKNAYADLVECFDAKNLSSSEQVPCKNGFESVFDRSMFTSTVITEWQLVCDNQWIDPILTLCVMAGLLFGVFTFGPIIDRIGRRKTIMVACVGLGVVQVGVIKYYYYAIT